MRPPQKQVIRLTEDQISQYAFRGDVVPEGLTTHEEILYWRLREIYRQAKEGQITAEQGAALKKMQVLIFQSKTLRAKRVNEILARYAGAEERNDDGDNV